jgi:hypothetical protein
MTVAPAGPRAAALALAAALWAGGAGAGEPPAGGAGPAGDPAAAVFVAGFETGPFAPAPPGPAAPEPAPDGEPRFDLAPPESSRQGLEVVLSDRPPGVPDDATLEARGAVVGEILIRAGDVFDLADPAEDRLLFRVANRLHRSTREGVIENWLLVRSGDPYSRRLLEESERLLRATRYLYDAQIRPVRYRDNRVDLEVITRDVWTLTAGVGLSRAGGENTTRFQVQDTNFLGTGRDVKLERTDDVDRSSTLAVYRDRALAGSRASLELWLGENSDGTLKRLELEHPFFALETRRAAGVFYRDEERVDRLYLGGEVVDRFRQQRTFVEVYGGLSRGLAGGRDEGASGRGRGAARWTAGFTYDRRRFSQAPKEFYPEDPPTVLPVADRTLAYPWLGWEWVEDRFLEVNDVDQLERTEDLYAGKRLSARLGYSPRAFAGDRDRVVVATAFETGWRPGRGSLLLVSGGVAGRLAGSAGHEDVVAGVAARYYRRTFGRHLFFATLGADAVDRLDAEEQLLLGGDNGLRGYPLRYQAGDRRVLATVEQRFYTDWHLFRLLHVGAAAFADFGRAWYDGQPPKAPDDTVYRDGWLSDVGFGLRLSSSRSGQGSMVHLDVAFPLERDPSIESVQWLVSTRETF